MSEPWGTILMVLVMVAGMAAIFGVGMRMQAERARKAGKEPEAKSLTPRDFGCWRSRSSCGSSGK